MNKPIAGFNDLMSRYKGDGPYLYIDGKSHIDAASGTFNLPLGIPIPG